jgi:hypothetical protein
MKAFAIAALAVLAYAGAASAQDTVGLGSLLPQAISALAPTLLAGVASILGIGLTWAATKFSQTTGIKIEQQRRDQLHKGIMTAVQEVLLPLMTSGKIPTKSEVELAIRNVPSTVLRLNPDASAYFDAGLDKIGSIAKAKAAEVLATWSQPVVVEVAK